MPGLRSFSQFLRDIRRGEQIRSGPFLPLLECQPRLRQAELAYHRVLDAALANVRSRIGGQQVFYLFLTEWTPEGDVYIIWRAQKSHQSYTVW